MENSKGSDVLVTVDKAGHSDEETVNKLFMDVVGRVLGSKRGRCINHSKKRFV